MAKAEPAIKVLAAEGLVVGWGAPVVAAGAEGEGALGFSILKLVEN